LILLGLPLFFVIESQPRLRQLIQGGAR
jgi:hypothetical protein